MKTKSLLAIILIAGVFFSQSLFSQDKKGCPEHGNQHKECIMGDLTDAQQKKIEEIKLDSDKKLTNYRADLKIKKAELDKLKIAENPSQKDIDTKIDEIGKIKTDMEKERVARDMAIRSELTPEQQVKFDAHKSKRSHSEKNYHKAGQHSKSANCSHDHSSKGNAGHQHKGCDKHQMKIEK